MSLTLGTVELRTDKVHTSEFIVVAPSGGVLRGDVLSSGNTFGFAAADADAGDDVVLLVKAREVLAAKKNEAMPTPGATLYWNVGANYAQLTKINNAKCGFVKKTAVSGDATVLMEWDGINAALT